MAEPVVNVNPVPLSRNESVNGFNSYFVAKINWFYLKELMGMLTTLVANISTMTQSDLKRELQVGRLKKVKSDVLLVKVLELLQGLRGMYNKHTMDALHFSNLI